MAENKLYNFNLPSPYQAELAKIADQQRLAEMLQAQSQQPTERFSYKGIEARTPVTAGLAKLLQGFGGAYFQGQAREQEKALGEKYRADQSADFTSLAKMLSAPAVAAVQGQDAYTPEGSDYKDRADLKVNEQGMVPAMFAVAGRRAGQIDPEMIGQFKTQEMQQMAMAQLLAQIGPEKLTEVGKGASLFSPKQGKVVFTAPTEEEYGTTPSIYKDPTSPTGYVGRLYSKTGQVKELGPINPVNQFTTGTVDAALKRDMDMYQFGNLSADQRASLGIKLTQAGVDVAKLNFDTGLGPARQPALPLNAPVPNFGTQTLPPAGAGQTTQPVGQPVAPVTVQPAPRIGMASARPTQPAAPAFAPNAATPSGQPITEAKPLIDTVTPRERQALMVAQPQQNVAAQSALQNMERLINVSNELKDHPGLNSIVGKANQYSVFDMTDKATNARALQSSLVKQSAVNALQAMRDASKTGGAVGAVSEKEWPILEQQLAALDGAQTTTAYKAALTNLNNQLTTSSKRIKSAYEKTYGQLKYESTPYEQQQPARNEEIPAGAVRRIR